MSSVEEAKPSQRMEAAYEELHDLADIPLTVLRQRRMAKKETPVEM